MLVFLGAVAFSHLQFASAGTATVTSVSLTSVDYVTGTTPTALTITALFDSTHVTGAWIGFQMGKFLPHLAQPTVTVVGGNSLTFDAWTMRHQWWANEFRAVVTGGTITGGSSIDLTITSDLVVPDAGAQDFNVRSGVDAQGTALFGFYTIAAPTVNFDVADFYPGTTPASLQVVVTTPFALSAGQTIVITANKAVLASSATSGLTVTGATFSGYTTNAGGTTFTGTISGNVNAGTSVDLTFGSAMMAALPSGAITLTIDMNSVTAVNAATVFSTIAAPTINLNSADFYSGTTPASLQVVVTTPFALSIYQAIVITANKAVLASSVTNGLTITGAPLLAYTTNAEGTTFSAYLNGDVNPGTSIDLTFGSAMMAALPASVGAVTLTIEMNSITVVNAATGFGDIVTLAPTPAPPTQAPTIAPPSPAPPAPAPPAPAPPAPAPRKRPTPKPRNRLARKRPTPKPRQSKPRASKNLQLGRRRYWPPRPYPKRRTPKPKRAQKKPKRNKKRRCLSFCRYPLGDQVRKCKWPTCKNNCAYCSKDYLLYEVVRYPKPKKAR